MSAKNKPTRENRVVPLPAEVGPSAPDAPTSAEGLTILNISPLLEGGRYAIKRALGEDVCVEADILKDGHDVVRAALQWRPEGGVEWQEAPMSPEVNDRWRGAFPAVRKGNAEYRVIAWADPFASWLHDLEKRIAGGQPDLTGEFLEGAALVSSAAERAPSDDAKALLEAAGVLESGEPEAAVRMARDATVSALMTVYGDRSLGADSPPMKVWVDRPEAVCAAWYEFFPRSAEGLPDKGSTFRGCIGRVEDAAAMGFDVIYFPPIHPIGLTKRKGRNNSLESGPEDPGVPYAIGNRAQGVNGGGHRDVAPELGTLEDFEWLVGEIRARGMQVALDFAINCSPDHPYVHEHPEWFFKRPDGSIKYAENPPKKYEDVYPLNFHNPSWRALWSELRDVLLFWCRLGVRIFRVDNPHTKPVAFWEWVIDEVRTQFPGTIFLSEAFTRPKMMALLAMAGFTQSYTYFTWRNAKWELREYVEELAGPVMREFFRPNFFTNTPDILPFFLQTGGRPAFCIRAVLAATLSPVYGIYSGFELCENTPIPEREEYLDSEKYQFKGRDWNAPGNIKDLITALNSIRREHRALQSLANIRFLNAENPNILFYAKVADDAEDILLIAVNLDPFNRQTAFVDIPIEDFGVGIGEPYLLDDLLSGETFRWNGPRNFIALDPWQRPAHILRLRRLSGRLRGQEVFD
jgi:starch synthase (maltosyl-transferring)